MRLVLLPQFFSDYRNTALYTLIDMESIDFIDVEVNLKRRETKIRFYSGLDEVAVFTVRKVLSESTVLDLLTVLGAEFDSERVDRLDELIELLDNPSKYDWRYDWEW